VLIKHHQGPGWPPPDKAFSAAYKRERFVRKAAEFGESDVAEIPIGEGAHTDLIATQALIVVEAQRRRPMMLADLGRSFRAIELVGSAET
jgi:hypothetical protein